MYTEYPCRLLTSRLLPVIYTTEGMGACSHMTRVEAWSRIPLDEHNLRWSKSSGDVEPVIIRFVYVPLDLDPPVNLQEVFNVSNSTSM